MANELMALLFAVHVALSGPTPDAVEFVLPGSKELRGNTNQVPAKEVKADLTVVVMSRPDGAIAKIFVHSARGKTEIKDLAGLESYLKKVRPHLPHKSAILITAESKLHWRSIIDVLDVCVEAGFKNVAFTPPLKAE